MSGACVARSPSLEFQQKPNLKDMSIRRRLPPAPWQLVENFTHFLQNKQDNVQEVLEEHHTVWNPYVVNTLKVTKSSEYDDKIDKLYNLNVATNLLKSPHLVFKFPTKKTVTPMSNTIFSERTNRFRYLKEGSDPIHNNWNGENMRVYGDGVTEIQGDAWTKINPEVELAKIFTKEMTRNENESLFKHIDALTIITNTSTKSSVLHDLKEKTTPKKINPPSQIIPKAKTQHELKNIGARKMEQNKFAKQKQIIEKNGKQNQSKAKGKTTTTPADDLQIKYENILNKENQILDLLKKQMTLLEQVARRLDAEEGKTSIRTQSDFDSLLEELDLKRQKINVNVNMTQNAVNSVNEKYKTMYMKSPASPQASGASAAAHADVLPTVRTVLDQTLVKNALQNDAYVQRILKMAKRKRDEYLKQAMGING